MAVGILSSAISGLAAFQRSLDITSNNIANVNTEGYSRQSVDLQTSPEQFFGNGYVGNGVNATTVKRAYDSFVNNQVRSSASAFNDVNSFYQLSSRIDNLLADQSTGLGSAINTFFNSVNDVANDPSSLPARQVMLSEGDALAKSFNTIVSRFDDIRQQVNSNLSTSVNEVNAYAKSVADLNRQIVDAIGQANGKQMPNALMDQRDLLLSKIAEKVDIAVVPQPDGSVSVFAGQGQPLVLSNQASTLSLQPADYDPSRNLLMLNGQDITRTLSGGDIYGNLRFRDEMLDPAQQQIGLLAAGMAEEFNAVYRTGYDLSGNTDVNFFDVGTPSGQVKISAGDPSLFVTVNYLSPTVPPDNPTQNWGASYKLTITGAGLYTLTDLSNNTPPLTDLDLTGLNDAAAAAGFTINISGTEKVGDTVVIGPYSGVPGSIRVNPAIVSPSQIAAASDVDLPGDNTVALKLAGLQTQNLMQGGKSSLSQLYTQMVASVGSKTRTASVSQSAQQVLLNQAVAAREDVTGVNLDEEAANLIKFQNSYQAAAKAVSIAGTLFDTLIGMVR